MPAIYDWDRAPKPSHLKKAGKQNNRFQSAKVIAFDKPMRRRGKPARNLGAGSCLAPQMRAETQELNSVLAKLSQDS